MFRANEYLQTYGFRTSLSLFIFFMIPTLTSCSKEPSISDWSVNLDIEQLDGAQGLNSRFQSDLTLKLKKLEGHPQLEIANILLRDHSRDDFLIYYSINATLSSVNIYIEVGQKECNSFVIYPDLRVERSDCKFQAARFFRKNIKDDVIFDDNSYELLVVRRSGKIARYVDPISPNLLETRAIEDHRRAIAESFVSVGSNEPLTNNLDQDARPKGQFGLAK